jgi:hypothetical protein
VTNLYLQLDLYPKDQQPCLHLMVACILVVVMLPQDKENDYYC